MRVIFYLDDVGVLLAERAIAYERREAEIEEFGECPRLSRPIMGRAGAIQRANDGLESSEKNGLEVGILLM